MVFPKRSLNAASTQCSWKSVPDAAAQEVPAATTARGYTDAPDLAISDRPFQAKTRVLSSNIPLLRIFRGPRIVARSISAKYFCNTV